MPEQPTESVGGVVPSGSLFIPSSDINARTSKKCGFLSMIICYFCQRSSEKGISPEDQERSLAHLKMAYLVIFMGETGRTRNCQGI